MALLTGELSAVGHPTLTTQRVGRRTLQANRDVATAPLLESRLRRRFAAPSY
jgi:hypothetical protein